LTDRDSERVVGKIAMTQNKECPDSGLSTAIYPNYDTIVGGRTMTTSLQSEYGILGGWKPVDFTCQEYRSILMVVTWSVVAKLAVIYFVVGVCRAFLL